MDNPLEKLLRDNFSVVESWSHNTLGFRVLPVSSGLFDERDNGKFIRRIKDSLPADTSLYSIDGRLYHMRYGASGIGADQICIVFGSSEWERLPSGLEFPLLEIAWIETAPKNDEIPHRYQLMNFINGGTYEIIVDKATQSLEIPKDRETESQLVIVVRSK